MSSRDLPEIPHPIAYVRGAAGETVCSAISADSHARSTTCVGSSKTVVTVGNFDGVHLGHAAIIERLRQMASRLDAKSIALTFDPHPATLVRPGTAPTPLSTAARRAELLLNLGIDRVCVQPVVPAVINLSATAFFDQVLRQHLGAVGLVEGTDFRFGRGREGDVHTLATLCESRGLAFDVVAPVLTSDEVVSSSRVRSLISAGDVAGAMAALTAPYRLTGLVVEGAKRGRTLGFPTANLGDIPTLLPAPGVYAAVATIPSRDKATSTCTSHPAAVHIGANVSFGEVALSVEAHLIGFEGDLYGQSLHVDFLQRLRETLRFESRESLVSQLEADVHQASDVVTSWSRTGHPTHSSL